MALPDPLRPGLYDAVVDRRLRQLLDALGADLTAAEHPLDPADLPDRLSRLFAEALHAGLASVSDRGRCGTGSVACRDPCPPDRAMEELLWALQALERPRPQARDAIRDPERAVCFSAGSARELEIKAARGMLELPDDL